MVSLPSDIDEFKPRLKRNTSIILFKKKTIEIHHDQIDQNNPLIIKYLNMFSMAVFDQDPTIDIRGGRGF